MTEPEPIRPTTRTQADLEAAWRDLMEPLGFSGASVWLMHISPDDRPLPQLIHVEECHAPPTPDEAAGFARMLGELRGHLPPGGRWAFLRSRPGRHPVTDLDRAWARTLVEACCAVGVTTDVVHLATDSDLVPLPLDELSASA